MLRLLRSWLVPMACLSILAACGDKDDEGISCYWPEIECDGACVNSSTSRDNCGSCGNACAEGEFCVEGACSTICPEGQEVCGDECVDLNSDTRHCGRCDTVCREGESCEDGACVKSESCGEGLVRCGDACVDTGMDVTNCGSCGFACEAGEVCEAGVCVEAAEACDEGLVRCGDACVDTQSDVSNCGTCGTVCDDVLSCHDGVCSCGAGMGFCGGECVSTQDDPENCGDCDVVCADLDNIAGTDGCSEGACVFTCAEGFEDCDGDWKSGCETDITSVTNCGACGNDCTAGGNIEEAACVNGTCEIVACSEGYARCDNGAGYGCETEILTNPAHCGACGRLCDDSLPQVDAAACDEGQCDITCAEGFDDCDEDPFNGCESPVDADVLNCGACGNICQHFCKESTCGNILTMGVGPGLACAHLEDGPVYCWGRNDYGSVGDGSSTRRLQPTPVEVLSGAKSIAAYEPFTCAVGHDDYVYCWGRMPPNNEDSLVPLRIENLGKAKQVAVGYYHICAIVENGDVYCWGANAYGQLGNGTTTTSATPVKVDGISNVVDLSLNYDTSCAVQANGELYCWGWNGYGAFADGSTNPSSVPKKLPLNQVTRVSTGVGNICAVNEDGEVHCAGYGEYGQLGDGIFGDRQTFVKVSSSLEFVDVAASHYTTCALAKEGTAWCWGLNELGMMGSPGNESATPRQVAEITSGTVLERGAGELTTFCALSTGQGMYCWGLNEGALGVDPFQLGFSEVPIRIEF